MRPLFLVIFFFPSFLISQNITFSEDYSIKTDIAYYLIDDIEDSFVLFRDIPRGRKIHIMDKNLMDAGDASIEFEFKNPTIHDVVKARGDQFSVIYSAKQKGERYLRIENFDKKGVMKDSLTIDVLSNLFEAVNFQIEKSDDETKALIYDIKFDKTINAVMVDVENLKVIWKKTFDKIDVNQFFQIKQFVVSNNGDFCLVILKDNSNLNKKKTRFELFTVLRNNEKIEHLTIPMKEKLSSDSKFIFDDLNNSLIGAGLYSDKNTIRSKGVFHLNIPLNNTKENRLSFNKFDEEFLQEYLRKRNIGNNAGITNTEITDIVLRKDGGILLMGESRESKLRGGVNIPVGLNNNENLKADYYFDQIFIASIHPDGKDHWTKIIQKKQYSFDDGGIYSSFFQFVSRTGLHLLFNDEIRSQSTISDFTIKGNGGYKRRAIINTVGVNIKLRVRDALQTSSTEIIIPSQYRNKLRMVRFSF